MAYKRNVEIFEEAYEKKDAKSVVSYVARDGRRRYIAGNKNPDGGGNMPSGGGMEEVTWQELKDKRDNGELNPGSLYRITDYQCTTTQENTRSAGHQFDIVLLALSENKLAEEGWAMMHIDNIYKVVFDDNEVVSCYVTPIENQANRYYLVNVDTLLGADITITSDRKDEDNKVITLVGGWTPDVLDTPDLTYNYFQNSNLSAWKVWYCLDNDTARFAWAQEYKEAEFESFEFNNTIYTPSINGATGNQVQVTINGSIYYQYENISVHAQVLASKNSTNIQVGDTLYTQTGPTTTSVLGTVEKINATPAQEEGRGVIYRLIDEWNIDYPCDFKNMQMLVPMDGNGDIDMQNPVTYKYCYAFTDNTSGEPEDLSIKGHAINIKVKPKLIEETHSAMYFSPTTLFYTNYNEVNTCKFSDITVGKAYTTIFINRGHGINILDYSNNVMLKNCSNICIGYDSSNIMFNNVDRSTFGSKCQNIQLTGESDLNYGNNGVELATKDDLN